MKGFDKLTSSFLFTFLLSCTSESNPPSCTSVLEDSIFLLETDSSRQTSGFGKINSDGCLSEVGDIAIGQDPAMVQLEKDFFLIARDLGTVSSIDPGSMSFISTFGVTNDNTFDSNPHDLAIDSNSNSWVARYDRNSIAILDSNHAWLRDIDLSLFADADGMTEAESIRILDGRAFISLENLDRSTWLPAGPGKLIVVDTTSFNVETSVDLIGRNPFGIMKTYLEDSSKLAIATPGDFESLNENDGAEMVDTSTVSSTLILSESDLGGSVVELLVVNDHEGYAIIAGTEHQVNPTWFVQFEPSTKTITNILADSRTSESPGFYYSGIAVSGSNVLLGDRTPSKACIWILDRFSGHVVDQLFSQKLLPLSMGVVEKKG